MKLEIVDDKKIEKNELSKNSMGGTELMQHALFARLQPELLENFQIIPSRVRELLPDRKKILWLHDLPNDPESAHLSDEKSRARFDGFVCVSNWQMQMYNAVHGLPYKNSIVIKNAIEPIARQEPVTFDDKIRLIYHTTPHRGLEILIPVFEHLQKTFPLHLDVFSSFNLYGWPERDKQYQELFDRCNQNDDITYHGAVSNDKVREALQKSHIFAYPSIWPETSCIAAIEALSAKNIVVCPNFAALPETCAEWACMYQWTEDRNEHANRFASTLAHMCQIIMDKNGLANLNTRLNLQKVYYDTYFCWDVRKQQWEHYLTGKL